MGLSVDFSSDQWKLPKTYKILNFTIFNSYMYYNLNTETMDYIVLNKKSNNFSYQLLISNKNKGSGGSVVAQQKC